ncbi:GGDEF domain-containing protein [uncultured Clostridium sp.]|uniref:GGDEF domain-containing protein n=1 Tax=uncultured Clostridium sp. TaxID=59620 RepID=UPI0025DD099B|nr:GGDEF domain-containing protein [uncultured Clostridium sp.]
MVQSKEIAESIYYMLKLSDGFKEKVEKMTDEEKLIPDDQLIGCSIGIVCYKMNKNFNVKRFIDCTDKFLYEAKRSGKGKVIAYE